MKKLAILLPLLLQTAFAQTQWSMGFWTAWGPNHPITDLDWGALTHVIQVGVEPQSNGSLVYSDASFNANATHLVAAAHANNAKILLNVWSGSGSDFNGAITTNLNTLVNNIMGVVNSYGYDGVDLDWEAGLNYNSMTSLLSSLRSRLGTKLSICGRLESKRAAG